MKKLLLIILLSAPACLFAQTAKLDSVTSEYKYDTVYIAPLNKDALFTKLKNWTDAHFTGEANKELAEISFHAEPPINYVAFEATVGRLRFNCKIIAKDNKFRVIVKNIVIERFKYDKDFITMLEDKPNNFVNNALKASDSKIKAIMTDISKSVTAKSDSDF